jgi:hypothetical protein
VPATVNSANAWVINGTCPCPWCNQLNGIRSDAPKIQSNVVYAAAASASPLLDTSPCPSPWPTHPVNASSATGISAGHPGPLETTCAAPNPLDLLLAATGITGVAACALPLLWYLLCSLTAPAPLRPTSATLQQRQQQRRPCMRLRLLPWYTSAPRPATAAAMPPAATAAVALTQQAPPAALLLSPTPSSGIWPSSTAIDCSCSSRSDCAAPLGGASNSACEPSTRAGSTAYHAVPWRWWQPLAWQAASCG